MPIYEYVCQACGHELEAIQKIGEPALRDCPACAKRKLKKKLSAGRFRLSGSGWYETDFKTGNKKNIAGDVAAGDKAAADKSAGDGAAKKEDGGAKPAPAADTSGKSSTAA